jgi:Kef-type K+ transport system membrane component KefB
MAEILAGILLGPTAFGYIPGFSTKIFPDSSLTVLETLANMGLIFFLFLVGLELDLRSLSK